MFIFVLLHQQLCYTIMCCKLCQQLFSTFFDFVLALSTKALKTHLCFVELLLPCSATLDNIHPDIAKSQQYFSKFFQNGVLTKTHNFIFHFCAFCTLLQFYPEFYTILIVFYSIRTIHRFHNRFYNR